MRLIIVTGANKGLGFELVNQMLLRSKTPTTVISTFRNNELGLASVQKLNSAVSAKVKGEVHLDSHQLDITDSNSIGSFVDFLKNKYGKPCIDVLVNNAGILVAKPGPDPKGLIAEKTLNTNFFSTIGLTRTLLPFMKDHGRVVSLSSTFSFVPGSPEEVKPQYFFKKFTEEKSLIEHVDSILEKARAGLLKNTFPSPSYCVSKSALSCWTRIISKEFSSDPRKILFFSVCPGWVKTDLGSDRAPLSTVEGIKTPYYLITEDYDKLQKYNGEMFSNCTPLAL
ncbi:hypothetical protein BB560_002139 [Smittium megazygosporum]|uniref:Carbonyl reductase [NADPH] 1 n=1 Tax=Smittium megazygosporum TaxID=133381 RepID=A0A2T9ZFM5_9FUNG|nr:hypothetical protein BB560_002139 [Smittium megazygosporum]